MRYLIQNTGCPEEKWTFNSDKITIGRDENCDIYINDSKVSRLHAELIKINDKIMFNDKGSTNGSYVNKILTTRKFIFPGDIISIGRTDLVLTSLPEDIHIDYDSGKPVVESTVKPEVIFNDIKSLADKLESNIIETRKIDCSKKEDIVIDSLIKQLKLICDFSKSLLACSGREEIYEFLKNTVFSIFPDTENFIVFTGPNSDSLVPDYMETRDIQEKPSRIQLSKAVIEKAYTEQMTILASDVKKDNRFESSESALQINIRSMLVSPIIVHEKFWGLIYLDNRIKPNVFKPEDSRLLNSIASAIGLALEKAKGIEDLKKHYHEILVSLISETEKNSQKFVGHTDRTVRCCLSLAESLNLPADKIYPLILAAEMHNLTIIPSGMISLYSGGTDTAEETVPNKSGIDILIENLLRPYGFPKAAEDILYSLYREKEGYSTHSSDINTSITLEAGILKASADFDYLSIEEKVGNEINLKKILDKMEKESGLKYLPEVINSLKQIAETKF